MCQYFIPFYDCTIFHGMTIPPFAYPVISLLVYGHLGHFLILAIMNNASYEHLCTSFWSYVSDSFGYVPRDGIDGSCGNCFLHHLYTILYSPTICECSNFSTSLPTLVIFCFLCDF